MGRHLGSLLIGGVLLCALLMAWNINETSNLREAVLERKQVGCGQFARTKVTISDTQTIEIDTERYLNENVDVWRARHDAEVEFRIKRGY